MNYEQKYKEALERAKYALTTDMDNSGHWAVNYIFPELKESESEKMKKAIMHILYENYTDAAVIEGVEIAEIVGWLEKQGKQPSDKIDTKFKVGDWVVDDETPNDVFCVIEVLGEIYKVIDIDGGDYHIPHCKADKQFHLWTLQDAKDGDVLAFDDNTIVIFKDLYNATTFHSYCHIEDGLFNVSEDGAPHGWEGKGFYPATKNSVTSCFKK